MNRALSQSEVKEIMLDMLKEIKLFCENAGIPYFLTGGTLLGAIRHKGFIPWDDDIDVAMFRNDYERFIRDFRSVSGRVSVMSIHSVEKYRYAFAKVIDNTTVLIEGEDDSFPIGVYIDVFPIDSLCEDLEKCKRLVRRRHGWQVLYQLKYLHVDKKRSWLKNGILVLIRPVLKLIPDRCYLSILDKLIKRFKNNVDSTYIANLCGAWGEKEITLRSNFSSAVEVEFEGENYPAPVGYDSFLRDLYGDYMKIPPIEKQTSHHNYKAFRR